VRAEPAGAGLAFFWGAPCAAWPVVGGAAWPIARQPKKNSSLSDLAPGKVNKHVIIKVGHQIEGDNL
jgi:hypothetical protein